MTINKYSEIESDILIKLKNEYLTSYEEWFVLESICYCIVMEYCENGDFYEFLKNNCNFYKLISSSSIRDSSILCRSNSIFIRISPQSRHST